MTLSTAFRRTCPWRRKSRCAWPHLGGEAGLQSGSAGPPRAGLLATMRSCASEVELRRQLDDARIGRAGDGAKSVPASASAHRRRKVVNRAGGAVERRRVVDAGVLGMVRGVEHLQAELQVASAILTAN